MPRTGAARYPYAVSELIVSSPPPPAPALTRGVFPSARRRGLLPAVVVVVLIGLFTARNLPWRLLDYDQAKQAFVSLEMAGAADGWLFQHTPGGINLATKPPLLGWLSAGFHVFPGFGNWEVAWRLPSALAAAALVFLLWRAGQVLWPAGGGLLAAGAFGLNALAPRLATLARTDMVLALWITALGLLVWRRLRAGGAWTGRERWAVGGLVTAAMLTKGPVVYAFLLPGLAAFTLWSRRWQGGETPGAAWSGLGSWLAPLAMFGLWLAVGCATVPGFYEQVVGREFLCRFDYSGGAVHVRQPVWFYVLGLLGRWAPWSVLALALGAWLPWRTLGREPATRWLVCWALGGLILMSLVPSKRMDRIFPVIPPLCLLLAAAVGHAENKNDPCPGRWARVALAAALVIAPVHTGYEVAKSFRKHDDALDSFGRHAREILAARGWRGELVVGGNVVPADEITLVALRRLTWLDLAAAAGAWATGGVDVLVLSESTLEGLRGRLGPFQTVARSEVAPTGDRHEKPRRYLLIRREK